MGASNQQYPDYTRPRVAVANPANTIYPDYTKPKPKIEDERSFTSKLPANILAGLAQMGHGLINTPHNLANLVSPELASYIPKQQEYNYPELLGLPQKSTMADKLIRGAAQYAPALAMPVAEMGIAGEAAALAPRMAAQAASQGAFGATQNQNPIHGFLEGAVAGAGGEALGTAAKAGFNALRPSKMFRGNLPEEELRRNLEATEGTETGLGRVIESPWLNRIYENKMPHLLGSGAENTMQKTANQIKQQAGNLVEKVRGNEEPGNLGLKLQNRLKEAAAEARAEKNKGYEALNTAADKAGLKVGRENLQSSAQNILQEMNQSPELLAEFSPTLLKDVQRYAQNPEGNTLKLSNIFRGKLGDKANELYQEGKMHEYGIVNSLKEALGQDIKSSFDMSGSPELKALYDKNQKDYMEKFAPFEDPDIVKFTRKGGDPDLILPHFLKGGKNDRAVMLSKISMPTKAQDKGQIPLVAYAHLSKAVDKNGDIDPVKLSTLYNNLGINQRKALFPNKETRDEFEKFNRLLSMNKEAFDLMRNPKTGARNTEIAVMLAQMIAGGYAGGLPGMLGTLAAGSALGKGATKLLTSEKVRKSLINKMLEKKPKKPANAILPGITAMEVNQARGEE